MHFALIAAVAFRLTSPSVQAPPTENLARWHGARIDPRHELALAKLADRYALTRDRYLAVTRAHRQGVPPEVLFGLHYRESSLSFSHHLHEGSSLSAKTRYVPKGRPPGNPPFTWLESAVDAVYVADKLQGDWRNWPWGLDRIESYNGMGYRKKGLPSPYLWSGTNIYQRGKYVADGRFDPSFVDKQLGVCAILKSLSR